MKASATSKGENASPSVTSSSSRNTNVSSSKIQFGTFDIIEFCKSTKIQVSQAEYLKMNPRELDRLIKYVRPRHSELHASLDETIVKPQYPCMNVVSYSKTSSSSVSGLKPYPFYVSLFVNGFRVNNYIIDSGASDNVMPRKIAKALGLKMTKTFGKFYSMDSKQVRSVFIVKNERLKHYKN